MTKSLTRESLTRLAAGAILAAGALAFTAGSASAYVACNDAGDCWHTDHREHWPGMHIIWHPDNWYWHHDWDSDHDHHWHHWHDGRGYWRGGVWIPL